MTENVQPPQGSGDFNPEAFDVKALVGRYPSYIDLLSSTIHQDDSMDAIIVPAARPVENIRAMATLAEFTSTAL